MTSAQFSQLVIDTLGFEPTSQQRALIGALADFCAQGAPHNSVFLLNGYAGTGKTSVIAALVKALASIRHRTVLLAPTGRAAKVMSSLAGRQAMTIHRKIYRADSADSLGLYRTPAENPHTDTIFIVDEASMIGGDENSSLLQDLISYVYGSGHDCRMILLGDTAQLPPVGCDRSPAMSAEVLKAMGLRVSRAVITSTVRQQVDSGILYNATMLRRALNADPIPPASLTVSRFDDVKAISGEDLEDALSASYSEYGIDETIVITRSNRRAMDFNLAIRNRILDKEDVITVGEPLLVAKNNYFWTAGIKGADFIANGEIAYIEHIYGTENVGYIRFADIALRLPDKDITLDVKIMLTWLTNDGDAFDIDRFLASRALANAGADHTADDATRTKILKADPYYNALRVKYAYAMTCHKAQGGQWESVFVDTSLIQPEALSSPDFYRWLYTSTTRAKSRLTYISPSLSVK